VPAGTWHVEISSRMVDRSGRWADGGAFAAAASRLHSKVGPRL